VNETRVRKVTVGQGWQTIDLVSDAPPAADLALQIQSTLYGTDAHGIGIGRVSVEPVFTVRNAFQTGAAGALIGLLLWFVCVSDIAPETDSPKTKSDFKTEADSARTERDFKTAPTPTPRPTPKPTLSPSLSWKRARAAGPPVPPQTDPFLRWAFEGEPPIYEDDLVTVYSVK
jgi:hypothetical protein